MTRYFPVIFACFFSAALLGQQIDTAHWITNGPVYALAQHNGKLYMGGDFTQVSPRTGGFVPTDSATGSVQSWPQVNGAVYTIAPDDSGGFFVGGDFSRVGHYSISNFFHVDSLGVLDLSLLPDPDGPVYAIEKNSFYLYVAGDFTGIAGQPRLRGACLDLKHDSLMPWDAGADAVIYDIEIDSADQSMAIGGDFLHAGGNARYRVAKVDLYWGHTLNYPSVNGPWALPFINGAVHSICISNATNEAFIGGDFTSVGSDPYVGISKLNRVTGAAAAFNPNVDGSVYDIHVIGSNVFFAGNFTHVGGYPRGRLASVSHTTALLNPWNPSVNGPVRSLIRDNGKWIVCGDFNIIAGQNRYNIAVMDTSSGYTIDPYAPMVNGPVWTAYRDFGRLFIGGSFSGIGGSFCKNLCRLDMQSGVADNWYPSMANDVRTLAVNGNRLFVAGNFNSVGVDTRSHLCAFDLFTDQLLPFNPGCDGLVRTFAFQGDTIFMGGNFATLAGLARSNLGAVLYSSASAAAWSPAVEGTVNALELTPQGIVVAGYFSQVANVMRNNIARVHTITGITDQYWDPDVDDGIYQLVPYGGSYFIGGWFQQVASAAHPYFCNLDPATEQAGGFNGQVNNFVRLLHLEGNTLFACGSFGVVQNSASHGFAAYDLTNYSIRNFNPYIDGTGFAMSSTTNKLYVGGSFLHADGELQPNLAVFDITAVTGLPEQELVENTLVVFPNPATDELNIRLSATEKGTLLIRDALGRVVMQQEEANTSAVHLDVSELSAGVYTAEWKSDESLRVEKFVKR